MWGGPVSAESPLLSAATLAKLSPAEAALAPQLAQVLLLQHNTRLKGGEPGVGWGGAGVEVLRVDAFTAVWIWEPYSAVVIGFGASGNDRNDMAALAPQLSQVHTAIDSIGGEQGL